MGAVGTGFAALAVGSAVGTRGVGGGLGSQDGAASVRASHTSTAMRHIVPAALKETLPDATSTGTGFFAAFADSLAPQWATPAQYR